jgi:nucleoside-diphosphate-sugar epimerase
VTGAAGFLGSGLAERMAAAALHDAATPQALLLTDRTIDAPAALGAVETFGGDIADAALLERLFARPLTTVFHLAAVVSGAAEADPTLGKRVNLDATIALLERCRQQAARGGPVVRFVQASSIAVFGTPLPARIDDTTAPAPTLSYGTHKRIAELLIDDLTRRGELDGRALRLPGIVVRPALPNGALSGFNSDLIREPLAGRAYVCPVGPEATIWIASRRHAIDNLVRLARVDGAAIGAQRTTTMPALALRVAAIVAAIRRADPAAAARIRHRPEPALEAQFGRWPLDCGFDKGRALGLTTDESIDAVLRAHVEAR